MLALTPVAAIISLSAHGMAPLLRWRVTASARMEIDDISLSRSLVARIAGMRLDGETKPLGPDDVSALSMGPRDVLETVFGAFIGSADAGCYEGCRVMLCFAQTCEGDQPVDGLGRLRPGAFASASSFGDYLR